MNKIAINLFATLMLAAMALSVVSLFNMAKEAQAMSIADIYFLPDTPTFYSNMTFVNSTFVETLYAAPSGDTFAYQYEVDYNTTQLNCTAAYYTAGNTSQFFAGHTTVTIGPTIDYIGGKITGGEALLDSDMVLPSNGVTIINVTFKIVQGPPIGGSVSSIITAHNPNTYMLDPSLAQAPMQDFLDAHYTYNWAPAPIHKPYDINGDGVVDMKDVGIAAKAFGTSPSDSRWNPLADVNADGMIDMRDIALVAKHFGDRYTYP